MEDLIFDKGAISTITINRPKALNALNRAVLEEITRVLRDVRHDPAVRVLIVTGGALLLAPGFITDILGLVLLIPPTRAM